jgi:hypothetical protein
MSVDRIGDRQQKTPSAPARAVVSLWLEAILWCFALGWIFFLAYDIHAGMRYFLQTRVCGADSLHWAQGCPPVDLPWRSMGEFVLIGLLVWWPMIRTRIKHGVWT